MEDLTKFLNLENWGYLFVTLALILGSIMVFSLLLKTFIKAGASGYILEVFKWLGLIIGSIYEYSNIEDVLSSCCHQLNDVLKIAKYVGYMLTFMKFIAAGALQLIFSQDNSYYLPVFKEFLLAVAPWLVGLVIATYVSSLTSDYLCWLCR